MTHTATTYPANLTHALARAASGITYSRDAARRAVSAPIGRII